MGKMIAVNRKARRDFSLLENYEAGIVLQGTEVKSLRIGRASLQDSFASIDREEVFLYNMHIAPYECGNRFNHEPKRTRKLLFHRAEIKRLIGKMSGHRLTLVPVRLYFKRGKVKVDVALAQGKREYDKREDIKMREAQVEIQRALSPRAVRSRR